VMKVIRVVRSLICPMTSYLTALVWQF
jgi:hypothetical protein